MRQGNLRTIAFKSHPSYIKEPGVLTGIVLEGIELEENCLLELDEESAGFDDIIIWQIQKIQYVPEGHRS